MGINEVLNPADDWIYQMKSDNVLENGGLATMDGYYYILFMQWSNISTFATVVSGIVCLISNVQT